MRRRLVAVGAAGGLLVSGLAVMPAAGVPAGGEARQVRDVARDPDGTEFIRYERTYDGLRVVGGDLIVQRGKGKTEQTTFNQGAGSVAVPSTKPKLKSATGELIVYVTATKPVLAYDVVTRSVKPDQTPSVLHTYTDANTGAVLGSDDEIKAGEGNSMYAGTVSIGTSYTAPNYLLKDPTRGNSYTVHAGTNAIFTDADDIWGDGLPTNVQTAAVDAHFGAQVTWDYYKFVHGRLGIFNNGVGTKSRVHYGSNYANAFWDGTQMTYGDGSGNVHPITSLDVAGHEMSHGVTQATANLNYSGEAGGLNESTSDIFGTMVEWYANNATDLGDYLIGEKVDIFGTGAPLRRMDKPSSDGSSPDCWSAGVGGLDPHYSSGPLNHWFYLAAEGTGPKTINGVAYNSTSCNGTTFAGIGRNIVAKVWYRTLATKLTSSSNYLAARNGAILSAKELYGAGSPQCLGIQRAFAGINTPPGTQTC
ncbi:M4 family metallopeptidase [Kribbella sp. NBC_01505]|uniref:M4 family metallopeptidase n=1 Tax=Kribbella sp. NBC_01505 TaxID=2903580 RepID=UPI00387096D3